MSKVLVVYDSRTGNTEKMAVAISEGVKEVGLDVEVKHVDNTDLDDLTAADAIVIGSPTYFGNMSARMKAFIDRTVKIYPHKLENKIGAAFTASGGVTDGSETALFSLIQAMLMHRMLIVGYQTGAHVVGHHAGSYGAVSIGKPDDECLAGCRQFGKRIAGLVKR